MIFGNCCLNVLYEDRLKDAAYCEIIVAVNNLIILRNI